MKAIIHYRRPEDGYASCTLVVDSPAGADQNQLDDDLFGGRWEIDVGGATEVTFHFDRRTNSGKVQSDPGKGLTASIGAAGGELWYIAGDRHKDRTPRLLPANAIRPAMKVPVPAPPAPPAPPVATPVAATPAVPPVPPAPATPSPTDHGSQDQNANGVTTFAANPSGEPSASRYVAEVVRLKDTVVRMRKAASGSGQTPYARALERFANTVAVAHQQSRDVLDASPPASAAVVRFRLAGLESGLRKAAQPLSSASGRPAGFADDDGKTVLAHLLRLREIAETGGDGS